MAGERPPFVYDESVMDEVTKLLDEINYSSRYYDDEFEYRYLQQKILLYFFFSLFVSMYSFYYFIEE